MHPNMHEYLINNNKEFFRSQCVLIEYNSDLFDPEFSTERHKVQFLCQAVLPYAWMQFTISKKEVIRFQILWISEHVREFPDSKMQKDLSSMPTNDQMQVGVSNESENTLLTSSTVFLPRNRQISEGDKPIETRLKLYSNNLHYVWKSDYGQRSRG